MSAHPEGAAECDIRLEERTDDSWKLTRQSGSSSSREMSYYLHRFLFPELSCSKSKKEIIDGSAPYSTVDSLLYVCRDHKGCDCCEKGLMLTNTQLSMYIIMSIPILPTGAKTPLGNEFQSLARSLERGKSHTT